MTPEILRQIAERHRPKGWRMVETRHRTRTMSGLAVADGCQRRLEVPRLDTLDALYVALHECGHATLEHFRVNYPLHVQEYQAETFAIGLFRVYMLPGVRKYIAQAKAYVHQHVIDDEAKQVVIWPEVRRWAQR